MVLSAGEGEGCSEQSELGTVFFFFLVLGSCFAKRYPLLGSDRTFFWGEK